MDISSMSFYKPLPTPSVTYTQKFSFAKRVTKDAALEQTRRIELINKALGGLK